MDWVLNVDMFPVFHWIYNKTPAPVPLEELEEELAAEEESKE